MDLRAHIRDDIIPVYEQFLRQNLVPVMVFSADQLGIINAFLRLYDKKPINNPEIDMMMQFSIFEHMKEYVK